VKCQEPLTRGGTCPNDALWQVRLPWDVRQVCHEHLPRYRVNPKAQITPITRPKP
jgi:hypothetical protein